MTTLRKRTSALATAVLLAVVAGTVANGLAAGKGAAYPAKPIELVVSYTPGAITDLFGRLLADELSKKWGVSIYVVNKGGGNTIPAVQYVMQAAPDGHTLLVEVAGTSSTQVLLPDLIPYKVEARTFIARVSASPHGFMVPATAPWKDLKQLTLDVKKEPAKLKWVSMGGNSTIDITTRQYLAAIGVDPAATSPVSFPGAAPGMTAVAGGHASLIVSNPRTMLSLVQAGKSRILAVTSPERLKWLPDVPTTKALGLPQVNYAYWAGFSGPAGLPDGVVDTWVKAIEELVKDAAFVNKLSDKVGMYPFYAGSKEFKDFALGESRALKQLFGVAK